MNLYAIITLTEDGLPAKAEAVTEEHAKAIVLGKRQEPVPLLDTWSAVAVPAPDPASLAEQGAW